MATLAGGLAGSTALWPQGGQEKWKTKTLKENTEHGGLLYFTRNKKKLYFSLSLRSILRWNLYQNLKFINGSCSTWSRIAGPSTFTGVRVDLLSAACSTLWAALGVITCSTCLHHSQSTMAIRADVCSVVDLRIGQINLGNLDRLYISWHFLPQVHYLSMHMQCSYAIKP